MRQTLVIALMLLAGVGLFACEDSGDTSKKDLCIELSDAFCTQLAAYDCPESVGCKENGRTECGNLFDSDCAANANEIDNFRNHIIPFWIEDKESCDAINGLESTLVAEVLDMKGSDCADGSPLGDDSDDTWSSVGQMCDEVLGESCKKVIELECAAISQADCVTALYQNSAVTLADVTCSDPADSREPSKASMLIAEQGIGEAQNATDCSTFGF